MKTALLIILFVWEFPQNIIGIAVLIYNSARGNINAVTFEKGRLFIENEKIGISLGHFLFWFRLRYSVSPEEVKIHEFGHSIQSMLFGPLYLIFIGVPSVARVVYSIIYFKINRKRWKGYVLGYPEHWAENLGKKYY